MANLLKLYLAVTGIGALIAIAIPDLWMMGGIFLIIPGAISLLMPTAFLYGCVSAALWYPLQFWQSPQRAAMIALAGPVCLLYIAAIPNHLTSRARLAEPTLADITPRQQLVIAGNVRLDVPSFSFNVPSLTTWQFRPGDPEAPHLDRCDRLCAIMLFTPGVESVTLNPSEKRTGAVGTAIDDTRLSPLARTFRRVPRAQCVKTLPAPSAAVPGLDSSKLEAEWELRLAISDCIIGVPTPEHYDLVVAQGSYSLFGDRSSHRPSRDDIVSKNWSLGARAVVGERFEIRRADGTILLRAVIAWTSELTRPLLITVRGGGLGANGGLERFGWSHTFSNTGEGQLNIAKLLKAHTNLVFSTDPVATARLARDHLQDMVDDPAVTAADPGWSLVKGYVAQVRETGDSDADRRLLSALMRDRRVTGFWDIWHAVCDICGDGKSLRDAVVEAMVDRLVIPEGERNPEDRGTLGQLVVNLPLGSFATPRPAEFRVLSDPALRRRAPELVARLSDRGADAVPLLLDILDYHSRAWAESRSDRSRPEPGGNRDAATVDAVRTAFCRMGPEGAPALPRLLALERGPDESRVPWDHSERALVLARLGQPVESFARPENVSGTTEQFRADLRTRLANFRRDRDCRSNFM